MNFTHPHFFLFLPIFFLGYASLKGNPRLIWLLISSYVFYGYFSWAYAFLLLLSTAVDYVLALYMDKYQPEKKKKWVVLSIVFNLGLLFSFKYVAFVWNTLVLPILENIDFEVSVMEDRLPPVGISFFTFQTMSYAIDVYRGHLKATKSFLDFAVYVSMFPQLVAGPIVRAKDLLPQIKEFAGVKWDKLEDGVQLFLRGLFKKACVADSLALLIVDPGFANLDSSTPEWRILVMLAYSFQIYFDFSGYSDMAIGMGKIMGFEFPVNFNHPYRSASFSEFWTRWHISLSSWLRDYLYIPLGGNRCSMIRQSINLLFTMLLGGLWHGASWMFVLWGGLHGLMLILQRIVSKIPLLGFCPRWVKILVVFMLTTLLWVPFRSPDFESVLLIWSSCFDVSFQGILDLHLRLNWQIKLLFLIAIGSHFAMAAWPKHWNLKFLPMPLRAVVWSTLVFWLLHFYPEQSDVQPFIYFQF